MTYPGPCPMCTATALADHDPGCAARGRSVAGGRADDRITYARPSWVAMQDTTPDYQETT